jgi:hypothetical protein
MTSDSVSFKRELWQTAQQHQNDPARRNCPSTHDAGNLNDSNRKHLVGARGRVDVAFVRRLGPGTGGRYTTLHANGRVSSVNRRLGLTRVC